MSETRTRTLIITPEVSIDETAVQHCYRSGSCTESPKFSFDVQFASEHPFSTNSCVKTMTDVVIKDFYKRRANGEVFMNPMTSTIIDTIQSPFPFEVTLNHFTWGRCNPERWYLSSIDECVGFTSTLHWADWNNFTTDPTLPSVGYLEDQAVTRAFASLDQSDVMSLVMLAEAEKSLGTITGLLFKAKKLIHNARKNGLRMIARSLKNKKARRALAKELSDLYLEARYGLRPIYYDVMGVVHAINKFDCKRHDRLTSRGFRSDSGNTSGFESTRPIAWGKATHYFEHKWSESWSVQARAGVLARVDLTVVNDWGLSMLGESAWELVPFSFIIDWFFNVGDTISSWMPKPNTSVLGSWVTTKSVAVRSGKIDLLFKEGGNSTAKTVPSVGGLSGSYTKMITNTVRTPNPSRSIMPTCLVRLDPLKLLDLGLIAKSLRKEKREFSNLTRQIGYLRYP